jgi:hypothetical protein
MLNGNFLLIGGKKDGSRISGCHEYSYREKWVKPSKVALSSPRSGVAVVVTSELIFVLGGNNGAGAVTQVEVFN